MANNPENDDRERDFFISYTEADKSWATWIAWHLESAGYSTVIQAWDIRPGHNFVIAMDEASKKAKRTIAVLSPHFMKSGFTPPEWAAAFAQDPKGLAGRLVPVLVEKTDVRGLLGQIVYIDLTEFEGEAAAVELLAGIQPGRSKPTMQPDFPGQRSNAPTAKLPVAENGSLAWTVENDAGAPLWRSDVRPRSGYSSPAILEIQLVPISQQLIPVRQLSALASSLTAIGRSQGLFTQTQQVEPEQSSDYVLVETRKSRQSELAGLLVTRSGHRGAWIELPSDTLGAVFDPKELAPRLAAVLSTLASVEVPLADRYGLSARLGPLTLVMRGDAKTVGNRNSASMGMYNSADIVLPIEDSVAGDAIMLHRAEVADEIMARLDSRFR
jgi:hypothetical protein